MPESIRPRIESGGYVQGQRSTVEPMPAAFRMSQTGVPRRRLTALGGRKAFFCS